MVSPSDSLQRSDVLPGLPTIANDIAGLLTPYSVAD
jgi:hypothetical protein